MKSCPIKIEEILTGILPGVVEKTLKAMERVKSCWNNTRKPVFIALLGLIFTVTLSGQTPGLEEIVKYRDSLKSILRQPADDRFTWENAMRENDFSGIESAYDAFYKSSKKAYETLLNTVALDADPGYRDACYEYALTLFMGAEGKIGTITSYATDKERTGWQAKKIDEYWEKYWHDELKAEKQMEIAEYDLISPYVSGYSGKILCKAVQFVLNEAENGFYKYKGAPTESPFEGVEAYNANELMSGAIKGVWFSCTSGPRCKLLYKCSFCDGSGGKHRFLVFTFFEDADREKAAQFYEALCLDMVSCSFPGWKRDVYRPEFGNANTYDQKWFSHESPDGNVQVRVVMGKPSGKDIYRVQIRYDVPSQM